MKKRLLSLVLAIALVICMLPLLENKANAASNVYGMWQDTDEDGYWKVRCTYFAWQQAYDTLGIALPNWGNAVNWYSGAKNAGYAVGSTPQANSIAVWEAGTYGHVAFVTGVSGNNIIVNEGGRMDKDGWYNGKATTDTDGIVYGDTAPSAVGSWRWGTHKLLGYIYLTEAPQVSLSWTDYPNKHWIGSTNAVLAGRCDFNVDCSVATTIGIYLYDYNGHYITDKSESITFSGFNYMTMWYDVNGELGYTLQPGTTYKYKLLIVISGTTYYSPVYSFTTEGSHTHSYDSGSVTQNPTCTAAGTKTYTCTTCGGTKTETISAYGHNYGSATCTSAKICKTCGATSGSALGHNWNGGAVTTAATCTTKGVKTYTCNTCGGKKTESIPATGHNWANATCINPRTCKTCGATEGNVASHTVNNEICSICGQYGTCGENLIWVLDDKGTLSISGTGAMKHYGSNNKAPWSASVSSIKNVVIGSGVTSIGNYAFFGCTSLSGVVLPDTVTAIGNDAFYCCTKLSSITIPSSITSIGNYAFEHCESLVSITIPENVTSIGYKAFADCTNLTGIWVNASNKNYSSDEKGVLFNKAKTILIQAPGKLSGEYEITDNVTAIDAYAFYNCAEMTGVMVPNSVTSIGQNAFLSCSRLSKVIYCGTEEQWNQIGIGESNESLINATRCYHAYDNDTDTTCNICGEVRQVGPVKDANLTFMQAPGLSFQDYIGMQLIVSNSVLSSYDRFYVIAVQETPGGEVELTLNGQDCYGVYQLFEQQIVSWSMTEKVTMTLCAEKNGQTYIGQTVSATVRDLAMAKLDTYAAQNNLKACAALVDMLNYGAAVQKAYHYNEDLLANATLGKYAMLGTADVPAMNASNSKTGTALVAVGRDSISMQQKVEIQLLFTENISSYDLRVVLNNTQITPKLDTESFASFGWTIVKVAVGAANMRDTYSIALYDANGKPVTQIYNVSVEAYAKGQLGGSYNDVVIAMMRYGDSVAAL